MFTNNPTYQRVVNVRLQQILEESITFVSSRDAYQIWGQSIIPTFNFTASRGNYKLLYNAAKIFLAILFLNFSVEKEIISSSYL